jgi:hypothetical protein
MILLVTSKKITPELVLHSDFYHAPNVTGSKINIEKRQKQSKYQMDGL